MEKTDQSALQAAFILMNNKNISYFTYKQVTAFVTWNSYNIYYDHRGYQNTKAS